MVISTSSYALIRNLLIFISVAGVLNEVWAYWFTPKWFSPLIWRRFSRQNLTFGISPFNPGVKKVLMEWSAQAGSFILKRAMVEARALRVDV